MSTKRSLKGGFKKNQTFEMQGKCSAGHICYLLEYILLSGGILQIGKTIYIKIENLSETVQKYFCRSMHTRLV